MGRTGMREVAQKAGVSTATVSHVINGTRYVSDETKRRVLEAIDQLGYSPNLMARIFKTGKKNLIGFIVPDIANDFFSTIIEEVEDVIGRNGSRLIVSNTKETREREMESVRVLSNGIVDGLVVASTLDSYEPLAGLVPESVPMVFIDRDLSGCPHDSIIISSYSAVYEAVETLISAGHSRIGYIAGLSRLSTTQERLSAYRDAMAAHGRTVEPDLVCMGNSMRSCADHYAAKLIGLGCTALVVSNNIMTDDVVNYLYRHDLTDKVALAGYNDGRNGQYVFGGVDMIRQPAVELGRTAGERILSRIAEPDQPVQRISLQASFLHSEI